MRTEMTVVYEIGDLIDMSQFSGEKMVDKYPGRKNSEKRVSVKYNIKNAKRGIVIDSKKLLNGSTSYTLLTDRFEKATLNELEIRQAKVLGSVNFAELFMND